ncbi:hypothetical protein Bbad01_31670 [Bacillus badius]|nr:hypothetical protein Bbad01_31670 [Bacillus badius]
MKGFKELRPITREEWGKYKTSSTWGYEVIKILAEDYFVTKPTLLIIIPH